MKYIIAFLTGSGAWYWMFWLGMKYNLPLISPLAFFVGALVGLYTCLLFVIHIEGNKA